MTKQEIEQAAKEFAQTQTKPEAGYILNTYIGYKRGAEMVNERQPYSAQEMYLNMQYYMEYCEMKGYVTPQDWIEKHKHF